jgi:hypothetical protein
MLAGLGIISLDEAAMAIFGVPTVVAGVSLTNCQQGLLVTAKTYFHGLDLSWCTSLPPEILKPRWRQLGVLHCVLDVAVAEIGLQRPRVMPSNGQRVAAGI